MIENIILEEVAGVTYAVIKCHLCEIDYKIAVDPTAFAQWRKGKWAQDAFPEMKASDRELFVSGTCDPCFKKLFGDAGLEE